MTASGYNSLESALPIPDTWHQLGRELKKKTEPGRLLIIGDVDTGKTTLAHYLVQVLRHQFPTALLDADLGQSQIGPPATVGLLSVAQKNKKSRKPVLKFVGNTSPKGCFLQMLVAVKNLTERATAQGIVKTVIDSCGMVHGQAPREFKYNLISILRPLTLIALEKESHELDTLLLPFKTDPTVTCHRLLISREQFAVKSSRERQSFRQEKFRQYFQSAKNQKISIAEQGLCGHIPKLTARPKISNLLIGLCDQHDDLLALGQLQGYEPDNQLLRFYSPAIQPSLVNRIHFGIKRLDLNTGK